MSERRVIVGFRVDAETHRILKKVASARGLDMADFLRELVRRELAKLGYLSEEEEKALGLR